MRIVALVSLFAASMVFAEEKPASPRGQAAAQWPEKAPDKGGWEGGKWIEIDYGRPILRGRTDIFGSGADLGKGVLAGGPVWRMGANETTRLKTQAAITVGGKKLAAGEYDLFVDFKDGKWTLVVSTQPALAPGGKKEKGKIWGAYGYDPKFDVARVPMVVTRSEASIEQLTIGFVDVSAKGGKIQVGWEHTLATAAFTVE